MCIVLFHVFGNNWTFDEMRPIFLVGLACELPCAFLACFFSDKDVVEEDDNADADEDESDKKGRKSPTKVTGLCGCTRKVIPYVMFSSSLLTAFGSGMTVKFFPLHFFALDQ